MALWLLDTSIVSFAFKRRGSPVERHIAGHRPDELAVSAITVAELRFGADHSRSAERYHGLIDRFLAHVQTLPFDAEDATCYGVIRAALARQGTPIGPLDLLIAGQARAREAVLVTNNTREFERVEGLALEDWSLAP